MFTTRSARDLAAKISLVDDWKNATEVFRDLNFKKRCNFSVVTGDGRERKVTLFAEEVKSGGAGGGTGGGGHIT